MALDINTPKGQDTLDRERRAIEIWHSHYPHLVYVETPKEKAGRVDGILVQDNVCRAVVETKCRVIPTQKFDEMYGEQWLVTYHKLEQGKLISEALNVPFLGFLYLAMDDVLLWAKLWDPEYGWVRSFKVQRTETQATVNGGKVWRDNAYIDMVKCDRLRLKGCQTTGQSAKNTE